MVNVQRIKVHANTLKWLATGITVLGVYAISLSPTLAATSVLAFAAFMLAHTIWAAYGFSVREPSLIWMNISMLPLDVWAMYIRI